MINHSGNAANQMMFEEHDGANNAKRVTIGAVSVALPISFAGNVTLSDAKTYIGLTTTTLGVGDRFIGLVTNTPAGLHTLAPSPNFIGLVTVAGIGTITLSDPKNYIGLTTTTLGVGDRFIGLATVVHAGNVTLNASAAFIGLVTVAGIGTLTLADPKGFIGLTTSVNGAGDRFIGLVTNVQAGLTTLAPSPNFIGIVTVGGMGDPKTYVGLMTATLGIGDRFIGLVTAVLSGNTTVLTRNAGTNKTLQIFPITISTGSAATVYVPSNKFYLTSIILNSNSTVRVNVRSGATYLTGNATIGIELNPGSGWVEMGSPDSPVYFGLAAAAPVVIEKTDYSGVISRVSGKLVLFDE